MATALVVDDAQVSRWLAGEVLRTRTDLTVAFAESGDDALAKIAADPPDVVVTDLMMPGLTGLELLARLQASHPRLPVVVMTAFGTEELAAQALRDGAASYIPKRHLSRDLVDVVNRVRNAAGVSPPRGDTETSETSEALTTYSIALDNDLARIAPLVAYFRAEIERTGVCDEAALTQFSVALDEALNNAMSHGNLEVDSALREEGIEVFLDRVRERRHVDPWKSRRTHVRLDLEPSRVVCVIRDDGSGFDRASLPDPCDPANLDRPSGRGLVLMQTFCDEVTWNEAGNEVTLVKHAVTEEAA